MNLITRTLADSDRIDLSLESDFQLGGVSVRPSSREVEGLGARHVLQPRVMQVLVALARPPARVVSQDELIRRCWSGLSVSDDAIGRCIGQLRKLTETWSEPPFAITTIAGVGYRLEARAGGAGVELSGPSASAGAPTASRRLPWLPGIAAALLVALAGVVVGLTHPFGFGAPPPATRVVVLALDPLSPRPESRSLGAGIADEIDRALSDSQIEALPRTDAVSLSAAADPKVAARAGVGLVVRGSITQVGGDALVNMRVEDASTHVTLWSDDFRREIADATGLREEIAYKVADVVGVAEYSCETPSMRGDDAALSAILQAHALLRAHRSSSWGRLLALTQRAVASEPDSTFAHAMAATADVYAIKWGAPAQQRLTLAANARKEADRALALDPHDAAAYYALHFLEPDFAHKDALLRKALAVATRPVAPLAALYNGEGNILLATGRLGEALPYFQRASSLDPLSPVKAADLIYAYDMAGATGAAQELMGQTLARWPADPGLRAMRLHRLTFFGSSEAARALLATPADLPANLAPEATVAWRRYISATPARTRAAALSVDRAAEDGALGLSTSVLMLARLHDLDHAFAQAEKLADEADTYPQFLFEPAAAPLRRDPRFMRLAARFGLPAYWRGTGRWPDFCADPHAELDCRAALSAAGL
jgi:DNA-binding winged helix-turn-helix (wHTH) protein/TolB-like protein/tetratricopeptide (TPR) repeat protein